MDATSCEKKNTFRIHNLGTPFVVEFDIEGQVIHPNCIKRYIDQILGENPDRDVYRSSGYHDRYETLEVHYGSVSIDFTTMESMKTRKITLFMGRKSETGVLCRDGFTVYTESK